MQPTQNLYLVHCGYYDPNISEGLFESHTNLFVVAENFEQARLVAKQSPVFKSHRMHIDGLQEIVAVSGHEIHLIENTDLKGETVVLTNKHRELAPKPVMASVEV
jgi:hypothetical protein